MVYDGCMQRCVSAKLQSEVFALLHNFSFNIWIKLYFRLQSSIHTDWGLVCSD